MACLVVSAGMLISPVWGQRSNPCCRQDELDDSYISQRFVLILLLLLIYIYSKNLVIVWLRRSWQLPGTSKALYMGHAMSSNPFLLCLFQKQNPGSDQERIALYEKPSVWWHLLLSHVRNFEPWLVCISFYRLAVFQIPLQGKGWLFVLPFVSATCTTLP